MKMSLENESNNNENKSNAMENASLISLNFKKAYAGELQIPVQVKCKPFKAEPRIERNIWRNDEVITMLHAMQDINALERLHKRIVKSETIFKEVEVIMFNNGFCKKSYGQISTKWKFLKSTYSTSRRKGIMPKMITAPIYVELHKMLKNTYSSSVNLIRTSNGEANGGSQSNDIASINGDLGDDEKPLNKNSSDDVMIDDNSRKSKFLSALLLNEDKSKQTDSNFDMAHPVFGFRLALVKPGTTNTGCSNAGKNSIAEDTNSMEEFANGFNNRAELSLIAEVKQESNDSEDIATKDNDSMLMLSPNLEKDKTSKTPPTAQSVKELYASAINVTTEAKLKAPETLSQTLSFRPLQVKPFAKIACLKNCQGKPQEHSSSSPTPTSASPPLEDTHMSDLAKFYNSIRAGVTGNIPNRFQKRESPDLPHMSEAFTSAGILKENATNDTSAFDFYKLKPMPMGKTPYSSRPEHSPPNLDSCEDSSTSPYHQNIKLAQPSCSFLPSNSKRRCEYQHKNPSKKSKSEATDFPQFVNKINAKAKNEFNNNLGTTTANDGNQCFDIMEFITKEFMMCFQNLSETMMQHFFKILKAIRRDNITIGMQQNTLLIESFQQQTRAILNTIMNPMAGRNQKVKKKMFKENTNYCCNCKRNMRQTARRKQTRQQLLLKEFQQRQARIEAAINGDISREQTERKSDTRK